MTRRQRTIDGQICLLGGRTTALRRPRNHFERKLLAICRKLSIENRCSIEYQPRAKVVLVAQCAVVQLWVAGSFARGATDCGDLDLIFKSENPHRGYVNDSTIRNRLLGAPADVRFYSGTPEDNSSFVAMDDAVLVWEPGMDYQAAIAAIQVNPAAGRLDREVDVIPVRQEQIRYLNSDEMRGIAEQYANGGLEWDVLPISAEMLVPLGPADALPRSWQRWEPERLLGKQSRKLLPALARILAGRDADIVNASMSFDLHLGRIEVGQRRIHLGPLRLGYRDLDQNFTFKEIIYIPHWSTRGPNIAWIIRKGPAHSRYSA